jgi:hypothetical protein
VDRVSLSRGQRVACAVSQTVALDTDFTIETDPEVHPRYGGDDEQRLRAHLQDDLACLGYRSLSVLSWIVARLLSGGG